MTRPDTVKQQTVVPPVPRPVRPDMTEMERAYLRVLVHWYTYRRKPPTLQEIGDLCKPPRHRQTVHIMLSGLKAKGYVRQDERGKWWVVP